MADNVYGGSFLAGSIPWQDIFIPEEFTKEHKAIAKSVKE